MTKRSKIHIIAFISLISIFYLMYFVMVTVEAMVVCGIISLLFGVSFSIIEILKLCALVSALVVILFSNKIHKALIEVLDEDYPKE